MNYSYPLRSDWSTEEIIIVSTFYSTIERAYEEGVEKGIILAAYAQFKEVVPSKSEEKSLFREFEQASSYKSFPLVRDARSGAETDILRGN